MDRKTVDMLDALGKERMRWIRAMDAKSRRAQFRIVPPSEEPQKPEPPRRIAPSLVRGYADDAENERDFDILQTWCEED